MTDDPKLSEASERQIVDRLFEMNKTVLFSREDLQGNKRTWWNGRVDSIAWQLRQIEAALLRKFPVVDNEKDEET